MTPTPTTTAHKHLNNPKTLLKMVYAQIVLLILLVILAIVLIILNNHNNNNTPYGHA